MAQNHILNSIFIYMPMFNLHILIAKYSIFLNLISSKNFYIIFAHLYELILIKSTTKYNNYLSSIQNSIIKWNNKPVYINFQTNPNKMECLNNCPFHSIEGVIYKQFINAIIKVVTLYYYIITVVEHSFA